MTTEQIWMGKGLNCRYGMCTASDSALLNLTLFRFFRTKLHSARGTVLNIHNIHHIPMSKEQIWINNSCNVRYEPNVAVLQFSWISWSSTQQQLLHIHQMHDTHTTYHVSTTNQHIGMNKYLNWRN